MEGQAYLYSPFTVVSRDTFGALLTGRSRCCALCPFGLTCPWFGMVWDAGNDVGLNKLLFPVYDCLLCPFLQSFHLGCLGVSHFGPILSVLHRLVGAQHSRSWVKVAVWSPGTCTFWPACGSQLRTRLSKRLQRFWTGRLIRSSTYSPNANSREDKEKSSW